MENKNLILFNLFEKNLYFNINSINLVNLYTYKNILKYYII